MISSTAQSSNGPGGGATCGDVEGLDLLAELALDMRSSWNHACDDIWRQLDQVQWDLTHNPWGIVQTVSRDRIATLLAEPAFRQRVDERVRTRRQAVQADAWFQRSWPQSPLDCVAYFSMEFMLSEALPIYSGGLGNVAGDQLKAASDLGVPVVAVGLLYSQGYFRQVIGIDGEQQALYPYNDPGQLPVTPLRRSDGEWLRLEIALPGYTVWLRAWQVQVGRCKLLLLDSNDAANHPLHRGITSELYGGGPELRLQQELLLGIGGWRLLAALGIEPQVCHLNEGHAAFAVLERARSFMRSNAQPFEVALAVTRAGNLFTTHTAVAAGFDRFEPALVERYLGCYAEQELDISRYALLALGRCHPDDPAERFNMAYLALRGSGAVNGVSALHGQVSRQLFQPLFPRWPQREVPVHHVTNGIHVPTWDCAAADALWTEACGKDRWLGALDDLEDGLRQRPDAALWQSRSAARRTLIDYARTRLSRQLAASGAPGSEIGRAQRLFDPDTLTLGFARRFASYKRPNLLLHDPQRLLRLLSDARRPVQLIMAGKAHPDDRAGQALIEQWTRFVRRPDVRAHAIFLADYDMLLTEQLVQGVDVWLNTPRRPWEACGTSGMKVLVNGGINVSELDGWWAEAYAPDLGWALGDGRDHGGDDPAQDARDADALYELLEREVVPEFYARDEHNLPAAWVARMRESMARLTPLFSSNRSVREYTERFCQPAAAAYRQRAAERGAAGQRIVAWHHRLNERWGALRFGDMRVDTRGREHVFEVELQLDGLDPESLRVELYAESDGGAAPVRQPMQRLREIAGASGCHVFSAQVPATRAAADYTPRALPCHAGLTVPLEAGHILWRQ